MNRFATVMAFGILALAIGRSGLADDKKAEEKKDQDPKVSKVENKIRNGPKADVVVGNAKTATAKTGQVVQLAFGVPLSPPFPTEFVVNVDGTKVDSKTYDADVFYDGKPVPGTTVKLVQFKAEAEGKLKVVVTYKQGEQRLKRELELEVVK